MKDLSVLVVGAGPVGLFTTLRLAKAGIKTTCVEALDAIEVSPRAMVHHPVTVREMDRAGVLEDVRKVAVQNKAMCWRLSRTGEKIAELKMEKTEQHPYESLIIGQHLLAGVFLEQLKNYENAKVIFGKKLVAIDQESGKDVKLTVEDANGTKEVLSADYVVASDGGKSPSRHLLGISFDGFTYPEQLVSTNIYYPFEKYGWSEGSFMVDPDHWSFICPIDTEGLWRVSYNEEGGLSNDEILERMQWKFSKQLPGPHPIDFELVQVSPYRLNQRCASTFRKGRVMLAGDAAHLNNPFGGLGLTGGLLDAAAVSDALIALYEGKAGEEILDKYAEDRRRVFSKVVDPITQTNKARLQDPNPETLVDRDSFLQSLRNGTPEEKEKIRALDELVSDMSKFYQ